MENLLPVKVVDDEWCDARELHKRLNVGKRFATWIRWRIREYKFNENEDFRIKPRIGKKSRGRPTLEYDLTIGMAKELCIIENNEEGRRLRRELIAIESIWKLAKTENFELRDQITKLTQERDEIKEFLTKKLRPTKHKHKGKYYIKIPKMKRDIDVFGNPYIIEEIEYKPMDQCKEMELREFKIRWREKVMYGLVKAQNEDIGKVKFVNEAGLKLLKGEVNESNSTT